MSAFRSAPRGDRLVGWRDWAAGLVLAWVAPAAMGLAVLGLALALGRSGAPVEPVRGASMLLSLHGAGWLMLVSPLLSWLGLVLLVGPAWVLLRLGLAGWVNMAAAGMAAGALAGGTIPGFVPEVAALFGAAGGAILRMVWGWTVPAALVPGD